MGTATRGTVQSGKTLMKRSSSSLPMTTDTFLMKSYVISIGLLSIRLSWAKDKKFDSCCIKNSHHGHVSMYHSCLICTTLRSARWSGEGFHIRERFSATYLSTPCAVCSQTKNCSFRAIFSVCVLGVFLDNFVAKGAIWRPTDTLLGAGTNLNLDDLFKKEWLNDM